ncbi:uroporphyrinogen decarboxylase family protein [Parasporobacterium paucivorans]|uniref:Uroporphyrinogen decarboxylase (URO-D) n=1 Tax=Parasporobacterium paucivorans DSM 15970 TaxID=1122934 RepID=A0A1M6K4B9_9FIRM|nr:uroporphyrinogen decarboxylase family protein [Parasporobacterium paucivorans]SHJ53788.1 Uroporphyrinogen decarboxylase (URO-D) [Parasporobacterium paucivorans DSM 15970]
MSLYEERLNRVKAAVALEPVDKIPFLSSGPAAYAAFANVPLGEYLADMKLNCDVNLKLCQEFEVDGTQAPIFSPEVFPMMWFSQPLIPGKDLGPNELWQIHEIEAMEQEDYDLIIEQGFAKWQADFLMKHFDDPMKKSAPYFQYYPEALRRFKEAGIPSFVDAIFESPFEALSGARSLLTFLMDDLMEIPEKLEEVFALVHAHNMAGYRAMLESPETRPLGVWIGGWRGTPSMLSKEMFEKFSWKYMKEMAELCIEYGTIPIFHLDSDWTLGLEYFKDIEPKKAILALDGKTDIFKAKEFLDGHMCIMGDVPAEMLAFGTAEETYDYCMKLIKEIGPTGYIMCSGCDIPFNAKYENTIMMKKAVDDYAKGK